jgi:flagellar biogenesis protein FliO
VKTYQIIFIIWAIVFAFWLVKQFGEYNKRKGGKD